MRKGFTLIEVLVVAVIVAILAAVAIPAYNGYIKSSKEKVAKNTAGTVAAAAAAYYSDKPLTAPSGLSCPAGGIISISSTEQIKMPEYYSCIIGSVSVSVMHSDLTASAQVPWR